MAKKTFKVPPVRQVTKSFLYDKNGQLIKSLGMEEETVPGPNGELHVIKRSENMTLMDGTVYNPSMSMGPRPMRIRVCDVCRDSSFSLFNRGGDSHGLTSSAKLCTSCGKSLCPHHRKRCRDRQVRCASCAAKFKVKGLLRKLFFTAEEK